MTDSSQLFDVLGALTLGGLLGAIGQGLRVIAGLKKMNDDSQAADASSEDLFSAARLATSLMIGFVAGVATTLSLGPAKLMSVDPSGSTQILLGVIVAGYVGSDVIEAFTRNLASVPAPKIDASLFARTGAVSLPATPPSLPPPVSSTPSLPAAPGRSVAFRGPMSTFGGPHDPGVGPNEGLALLQESDIPAYPGLFLPQQPPGTTGLARRLDPDAFYIACRWNYDDTPKAHLRKIEVSVVNPSTGAAERAQPVDWGPNENTGRIADLSPGLAHKLGLSTNQNCVVVVPLPESAAPAAPPAPVTHLKVLKTDEIREIFGRFAYEESAPRGAIKITDDWARDNIVTVQIEALANLVAKGEIACNKAIAEPLRAAIAEIAARDLLDRILKWDGCHVPRHKSWNPTRDLSAHSWGLAFDINARWNAYGADPAPKGSVGSVVELVAIFESFGFAWGGYFRPDSARDGMHFEFCRRPSPGGQIV